MNKKLSPERESLVTDNSKLVFYCLRKFGINIQDSEFQDYSSVATIGLIKAAITYKPETKFTFSTYACKCIKNEIIRYINYSKKSIDKRFFEYDYDYYDDGEELENSDIFAENFFAEKDVEEEEEIEKLINIILNCLKKEQIIIFFYRIAGLRMKDATAKLGISPTYTTNLKNDALKVIKSPSIYKQRYKRKIIFSITDGKYRFTFFPKDKIESKKFIKNLLKKLKTDKTKFVIVPHTSLAIIELEPLNENFEFIANLIYEVM